MGKPLIIAYFISAGVIFMAGCQAALLARSTLFVRASRVYAALCLCFALFQVCNAIQYAQQDLQAAVAAHKWVNLFSLAILPLIAYSVAALEGGKTHYRLAHVMAGCIAILIVYNFAAPLGYRFSAPSRYTPATLPWGESIHILSGEPSLAFKGLRLISLGVVVYLLVYVRSLGKLGELFSGKLIAAATVLMVACLTLAGMADSGQLALPYLGGFAFLFVALSFPLMLGREISTGKLEQQRTDRALRQEMATHKETLGRLDHLLHHDELTGLPNRAGMLAWLEGRLAARALAQTADTKLVVLLLDIDQFDVVNATQGHDAGDALLVQAARRLRENRRDGDLVARVATNGFVVITGLEAAPGAQALYQQLSQAFAVPFDFYGTALSLTVSAGAAFHPDDAASAASLLAAAELALHAARESGQHRLHFFHPVLNHETQEKVRFGNALRGALEQQQFFLLYQPQVRASDAGLVCMEALIRWSHPDEGTLLPGRFIPIAEEADLIGPLGAWVIDTACRQLADWRALGFGEVRMAVNLSSRQLLAADLQDSIAESIGRHRLRAADLELEITESALMRDPERSIAQLEKLRRLGIRLSIDDFGTGYSSLNYIKVLPVHAFKLDRTFVQDIEHGGRDLAICETTIRLAHDLGLEVVAEGVETAQQARLLRQLGCHLLQGYHFARPLAPQAATDYLVSPGTPALARG